MHFITGILSIITLTLFPIIAIVGVISDPEYRNVPVFLFLIFCFYIGVKTWMLLRQDHIKKIKKNSIDNILQKQLEDNYGANFFRK